jgi:uracil-DNA glycosylase family 4
VPDLINDIRRFFERERDLYGESLIIDMTPRTRQKSHAPVATTQPQAEPVLFETPLTTESWGNATSLAALDASINTCQKCPLGGTRTNFVFGVGNPQATLMVIGEAPGADEDAQGEPFVGRAGQLLTKILEAINFRRDDVYICNILKCRPPGNRKPTPEESELCTPYLKKQIGLIQPKVILCLGLTAAENLLKTKESMTNLRGKVFQYENTPVMVTYHPAALLRNPNWKRPTWEDVQAVRRLHDERVSGVRP